LALTPGTRLGVYEVIAQIAAGGMGVDAGVLHVPGILDLAKFGLRVIIPDQPGHGQSERGSQSEYSHRTWALDAHKLVGGMGLCHGLHDSAHR
jgi:pimeloyl-ACP methyl ester carboxylesterase